MSAKRIVVKLGDSYWSVPIIHYDRVALKRLGRDPQTGRIWRAGESDRSIYEAAFFKELRTRVGMTQPRLGELTGFSRDDIANFERGLSHIDVASAVKLYEALATADDSGEALAVASIAATDLKASRERSLDSAKDKLQEARKYVEAARGWLAEAKSNEKRIRAALKAKRAIEGKPK